jgi:NAD(P)-dependent dehydrogenase (short-subunit alcohol dehydrogenase family)
MHTFTGKNILIVGGNSGIGLSLVNQLVQLEAHVITASRRTADQTDRAKVTHISLDVTKDLGSALADLPQELHGLVYCPGTINLKPFSRLSEEDFLQDMQINVFGAIKVVQASLKALKSARGSSVVFFSTAAAKLGMNFHASIATAKRALEGLAISLAAEYAQNQIRFNVIAPSLTDTPLAGNLLATPEKKELSSKRHPLGRTGNADEIASLAAYLLSDQASWMSGQIIGIDGGISAIKVL